MNRRTAVLSAVLMMILVIGMQLGTPLPVSAEASVTAPSIDTTPSWNGALYVASFGLPNTATYGQTITMTETATLTRFSFYMKVIPTAVFRGLVYAWDGTKATGDALFESAAMSTTQGNNFEEVVFNIPCGIVLNAGQQYVLFASVSKDPSQPETAGSWGATVDNTPYSGGQFVFINNGTDPSQWTSMTWSTIGVDLAFRATIVRPSSIDTTLSWNRANSIHSFGLPDTATYGQTITIDNARKLNQFSFYLQTSSSAVFRGFVYQWDGAKATGNPLFESGPMSTTQGTKFEEVAVTIPGGVVLEGGHQYVLFISVSLDPTQPATEGNLGANLNDTFYTGGHFVFLNNVTDATQWIRSSWSSLLLDSAFKADLQWQSFIPVVTKP